MLRKKPEGKASEVKYSSKKGQYTGFWGCFFGTSEKTLNLWDYFFGTSEKTPPMRPAPETVADPTPAAILGDNTSTVVVDDMIARFSKYLPEFDKSTCKNFLQQIEKGSNRSYEEEYVCFMLVSRIQFLGLFEEKINVWGMDICLNITEYAKSSDKKMLGGIVIRNMLKSRIQDIQQSSVCLQNTTSPPIKELNKFDIENVLKLENNLATFNYKECITEIKKVIRLVLLII